MANHKNVIVTREEYLNLESEYAVPSLLIPRYSGGMLKEDTEVIDISYPGQRIPSMRIEKNPFQILSAGMVQLCVHKLSLYLRECLKSLLTSIWLPEPPRMVTV